MKLPLLYKELCEKASSKNLYRIRLLYGVVLYSCFLWSWYTNTLWSFNALGKGRTVLNYVFITNLVSILLFVPTISAATIARERERNTLPLLLICKISPWQILLEKFISLVIISFSLVMMSFPLMYLSYTLGGVSNQDILSSILAQLLIIIHIIAVALFCSCHARNTSQAIIATYTLIFILFWELGILFVNPSSVYNKRPFSSINIYLSLFLLVIALQGMAKNT